MLLPVTNNFSTSDHHSASFKITTSIPTYSIPTPRYDYTKADWSAINNHLFCIDWQTAFAECLDLQPSSICGMISELKLSVILSPLKRITITLVVVPTYILFISENYFLKSAPPGEYINSLNPLPRMLGIKLLRLATEKLYIHLNVTENWLWSTGNNLLESTYDWTVSLNNRNTVNILDIVF